VRGTSFLKGRTDTSAVFFIYLSRAILLDGVRIMDEGKSDGGSQEYDLPTN
jgi:hypothetical protein